VQPHPPPPWLYIADEVAQEAKRRGFRKLGITGTHRLVRSEVYPERLRRQGLRGPRGRTPEVGA
jgi:aspartate racemase